MSAAFRAHLAHTHRSSATPPQLISAVAVSDDGERLYLGLSDGQLEEHRLLQQGEAVATSLVARKVVGKRVRLLLWWHPVLQLPHQLRCQCAAAHHRHCHAGVCATPGNNMRGAAHAAAGRVPDRPAAVRRQGMPARACHACRCV